MDLKTVIFMGRSGSGKGTQVELLRKKMISAGANESDFLDVRTGDLFRAFIKEEGHTQELVKQTLDKGARQPEFLAVTLWGDLFVKKYRPGLHLFLDGTPRIESEAKMLENALVFYKRAPIDVVDIEVSDKWATERLLGRNRSDDNALAIAKRMEFYRTDVTTAISYLKSSPHVRYHVVNGERAIEEVHKDIADAIL